MVNFFLPSVTQGMEQRREKLRSTRLENSKLFQAMMDDAAADGQSLTQADLEAKKAELAGGDPLIGPYLPAGEMMGRLQQRQNQRAKDTRLNEQLQRIQQEEGVQRAGLSMVTGDMPVEKFAETINKAFPNPEDAKRVFEASMPKFHMHQQELRAADVARAKQLINWDTVQSVQDAKRQLPANAPKYVIDAIDQAATDIIQTRESSAVQQAKGQYLNLVNQYATQLVQSDEQTRNMLLTTLATTALDAAGVRNKGAHLGSLLSAGETTAQGLLQSDEYMRREAFFTRLSTDDAYIQQVLSRADNASDAISQAAAAENIKLTDQDQSRVQNAALRATTLRRVDYVNTYNTLQASLLETASGMATAAQESGASTLVGLVQGQTKDRPDIEAWAQYLANNYYLPPGVVSQVASAVANDFASYGTTDAASWAANVAQEFGLTPTNGSLAGVAQAIQKDLMRQAADDGRIGPAPGTNPSQWVTSQNNANLANEVGSLVASLSMMDPESLSTKKPLAVRALEDARARTEKWMRAFPQAWEANSDLEGAIATMRQSFTSAIAEVSAVKPNPDAGKVRYTGTTEAPQVTSRGTLVDPDASGFSRDVSSAVTNYDVNSGLQSILTTLGSETSPLAGGVRYFMSSTPEARKALEDKKAAKQWFGSKAARELLDSRPDLINEAVKDPVTFFKENAR